MNNQTSTAKTIFRENALNNLNAVVDIQYALKVIDVKSITYLTAGFLAFMGMMAWGVMGNISVEVPATGILLTKQQIELTEKRELENKNEHAVALAAKKLLLDKKQMLYDKHYLTMDDLDRAKQDYLAVKHANTLSRNSDHFETLFADAEFQKNMPMEALVFVSHVEGKKIAKGMRAYLLPSTLSSYEYGYINGKVEGISEFPATKESVYSYLGNSSLVDEYFSGGPPFVVKIKLENASHNASGLSWTTSTGSPFKIDAGSMVSAKIISRDYHPYQLLMKQYLAG